MQIRERKLLSIVLMVLVVTFMCGISGCSSGSQESGEINTKSAPRDQEPMEIQENAPEPELDSQETGFNDNTENLEEERGTVDKGTPCRNHRYYLSPGASDTLSFEAVLTGANNENFDPSSLILQNDNLEQSGVEASLAPSEVETVSVSYPIWRVDGKAFYDSTIARGMKPTLLKVGNVSIKWDEDGTGILTRLLGHGNARSVGRYSEQELKKEIGEDLVISYSPPGVNETYNWEVQTDSRLENYRILKIGLNITMATGTTDFKGKSLIITAGPLGWTIKIAYSGAQKKFIVTGPATSQECLEKNE